MSELERSKDSELSKIAQADSGSLEQVQDYSSEFGTAESARERLNLTRHCLTHQRECIAILIR